MLASVQTCKLGHHHEDIKADKRQRMAVGGRVHMIYWDHTPSGVSSRGWT